MTGPKNLLFCDVLITVAALFSYSPYAQALAHFSASQEMPKQSKGWNEARDVTSYSGCQILDGGYRMADDGMTG